MEKRDRIYYLLRSIIVGPAGCITEVGEITEITILWRTNSLEQTHRFKARHSAPRHMLLI